MSNFSLIELANSFPFFDSESFPVDTITKVSSGSPFSRKNALFLPLSGQNRSVSVPNEPKTV